MLPKTTPVCLVCGRYKTTHPSGVCSCCRKLKGSKPCIRCGQHKTLATDGICSVCRTSLKNCQGCRLTEDQAIERAEELLSILKWHRKGVSYSQISELLGIPRSTAFHMAMRARNMAPTTLEIADPDANLEDKLIEQFRDGGENPVL